MVCHFNFSEAREYRDKGELPNEKAYQTILDFEKRVLGAVDRVIYVSSWAKRIVEEERGITVRSSSVIWNGIAAEGAAAIARAEIGVEPGDLVLMNVGTLEKRKNQLGLIDLFAAVAQKCAHARLVLVGEGPQRTEIRKRIAERGLAGKVHMLGMRHDVPALLAAADLYVHFAAMENCPVVLLEAARAGLPIAAVPGGGVPELMAILGGVTLNSSDVALSLSSLQPLLEQETLRRRAGQAARAAFESTFTRQAMVGAYLNSLADSSAGPREVAS
jgi:glycosyltransferase involved in cell wall biosynthesis